MRAAILLVACLALLCFVAAEQPAPERHGVFPPVLTLTKLEIDGLRRESPNELGSWDSTQVVSYHNRDYLVRTFYLGNGVPYTHVAVYAPHEDGAFHLCLFAESWAALWIRATIDEESGILMLREKAEGVLKGEVVLSCNLKTIGTQSSTIAD